SLPSAEYPDPETARTFYRSLRERLEGMPGVLDVALASSVPLEGTKSASALEPADRPLPEGQLGPLVDMRWVGPGYFETMGIELVEGRGLTEDDGAEQARSVVVSERLAREFWPGEASVLGRRIQGRDEGDEGYEVVGVARDVRYETLTEEPALLAYLPLVYGTRAEPVMTRALAVVVRTAADPLAATSAVRAALREVDPWLPMVAPRALASVVADAGAPTSFTMVLLGMAAGIAMLLGTVGIYGVVSYV